MQTELYLNSILEVWTDNCAESDEEIKPALLRVIWLNNEIIVTIDIQDKTAQPEIHEREIIENGIIEGNIQTTSYVIPRLFLPDNKLKEKDKAIRDHVWTYIQDAIAKKNVPDIFRKKLRGIIIEDIHDKTGKSKTLIRNNLRKYWQRGMTINALLPNYVNCGGKGESRSGLGKKLGNPNQEGKSDPDRVGVNVTEEMRMNFRKSIKLWYNKKEKRTLYEVYELMLGRYFKAGIDEEEGIILKPEYERPTYRQYYYWHQNDREIEEEYKKRQGQRRFNLKHRAIDGTFNGQAMGPGSRYQIDATIGNVYLVNRRNRNWLIGRPVIYFVVDVFSRLIAGLYVGLEGPSWIGAALALENAASDKVEYCKRFGIEITSEEWPSFGLPEILTTDRGEYAGNKPGHLIKTLNVKVEHLPPYRPDWKPHVEKQFHLSDDLYVRWTPGGILERMKERGESDTKEDSVLDIHEFETILIDCVRYHNKHYMTNYRRNDAMVEDNVQPIPSELWKWGRKKSLGSLSFVSRDELRMNLLPSRKGRFTASGIKFNRDLYTCISAEDESWRFQARNGKKITVEYSFDPRDTTRLFLRHEDGSFEECFKLEEQSDKYIQRIKDVRWEEDLDIIAYEARMAKKGKSENTESKLNLFEKNKETIKNAKIKTEEHVTEGKSTKSQDIKEHRGISKEEERIEKAWILKKDSKHEIESQTSDNVVSFSRKNTTRGGYVPPLDQTALLRRAMEED